MELRATQIGEEGVNLSHYLQMTDTENPKHANKNYYNSSMDSVSLQDTR